MAVQEGGLSYAMFLLFSPAVFLSIFTGSTISNKPSSGNYVMSGTNSKPSPHGRTTFPAKVSTLVATHELHACNVKMQIRFSLVQSLFVTNGFNSPEEDFARRQPQMHSKPQSQRCAPTLRLDIFSIANDCITILSPSIPRDASAMLSLSHASDLGR